MSLTTMSPTEGGVVPLSLTDDWVLLIKPPKLLVHPNEFAPKEPNLRAIVRRHLQGPVHTVHRIDRATSGLVLMARSPRSAALLSEQFKLRTVTKHYLALLRGHLTERTEVDRPVKRDRRDETLTDALSVITPLAHGVVHEPVGKFQEGWFTLAEIELKTGRHHQARKHCHYLSHPVIGDKHHGDRDQNRYFQARFEFQELFLRSYKIQFSDPASGDIIEACGGLGDRWAPVLDAVGIPIPESVSVEPYVRRSNNYHDE